jgi:molybdate transport system regulatory protein
MKLIYKIWLEDGDSIAFGEGLYRLLIGIEATGSLLDAAAGMGMAYSKARRIIKSCEFSLGFALTTRKIGGISGGGSEVTADAIKLMRVYETLRAEVEDALGEVYKKHFGQSIKVEFYTMTANKRGKKKPAG